MKRFNFLAVSLLIMSTVACSDVSDDPATDPAIYLKSEPIELTGQEVRMTTDGKTFAIDFFASVYEEEKAAKDNIVLSPLSLSMALAMVWNGADGETRQAIQEAMRMDSYPQEEMNRYFKKLGEAILQLDPTVKLALANSIWYEQTFPVKESFITANKNWYNAEVNAIDFLAPDAPGRINKWCSDHTNGLIKGIVNEIDGVMYLLNALYFKGEWPDNFRFETSATSNAKFRKENGTQTSVKLMHQKNILQYYHDEHLALTALPYGNNAFSMLFLLPDENTSFEAMVNQLKQPDYWQTCVSSKSPYDVDLFIPKFKIAYETELNKVLKQMGMGIAFNELADFSGISNIPLFISKVKQKAFIEVDEKGTEAAAVTSVEMMVTSVGPPTVPPKVTFRADRPFLFAIQENSTGAILFVGKIGNPE